MLRMPRPLGVSVDLPSTTAQFVALIVIVLPGVTYATVRNRARGLGASTIGAGSKLGEGLAAGVVFDVVYILVFGDRLVRAFTVKDDALPSARSAALYALVLGIAVPSVVAWLAHRGSRWTRPTEGPLLWIATRASRLAQGGSSWRRKWIGSLEPVFSVTPTAWDHTVAKHAGEFIRIELASGKYVGGWFDTDSFISMYPEPHDVYVEEQWHINENGSFTGKVERTEGFWYTLQPGDIIEWLNADGLNQSNDGSQSDTEPAEAGA